MHKWVTGTKQHNNRSIWIEITDVQGKKSFCMLNITVYVNFNKVEKLSRTLLDLGWDALYGFRMRCIWLDAQVDMP